MSLTQTDRSKIYDEVIQFVVAKHINVKNPWQDYKNWQQLAQERRPQILAAVTDEEFEAGIRALLAALGSSHTAFIRPKANDVPAQHAINATVSAACTGTEKAWMFVDVIDEGIAHQAGIKPRGERPAPADRATQFCLPDAYHTNWSCEGGEFSWHDWQRVC